MRLVAVAVAAVLAAAPAAAQNVPIALAPGEVLLNVQEDGVHRVRPDVMELSAGVVTTGRTAREALASNNALAERLLAAVRSRGIAPADVRTEELSVRPQLNGGGLGADDGAPARIAGYVATNRLTLRLRDLSKAPEIVSGLFEAGANSVEGPRFDIADPAPARREARRAAVAAARREAEDYASALNMRVARVLRVSERGGFDSNASDGIFVTGSRIRATPLEPGELPVKVTVWVDYALVPR